MSELTALLNLATRLQAEERVRAIADIGVGVLGNKGSRARYVRKLEREAQGGRRVKPKPATPANLSAMGFQVVAA